VLELPAESAAGLGLKKCVAARLHRANKLSGIGAWSRDAETWKSFLFAGNLPLAQSSLLP